MLSFKQQPYEADTTPRWSIGVDKRHVAVYIAVAVVAGFALGFVVARTLNRKDVMATPPPGSSATPARQSAAEVQSNEFRPVTRILRADTIEVDGVGPVRMIGVETPDGKTPREIYAAHGQNALNFVEKSLLNQDVRLEFDPANAGRNKDESGQTLAYVYTRDGSLINIEIIKQGLGFVRTVDQFKLSESFRAQEREAMQSMRGVWGSSASAATSTASGAAQPPPNASPGPTEDKPRKLSPLSPSAIGPNIPAIAGASTASSTEPSVFVSPDEKIYHKSGCELLGKKKQAIPLSEARSKGYAACSRCFASTVLKAP